MSKVIPLRTKTQAATDDLRARMEAMRSVDLNEEKKAERAAEEREYRRKQYRNLIALYSSKYRGIEGVADEEVDNFLIENLSAVKTVR